MVDELLLPRRIIEGDFEEWMRDAMADRRITQRALAMRPGINHSTISRLLASGHMPSPSTATAIVKVLGSRPGRPDVTGNGPVANAYRVSPARASGGGLHGVAAGQRANGPHG